LKKKIRRQKVKEMTVVTSTMTQNVTLTGLSAGVPVTEKKRAKCDQVSEEM
jgi:hypothetical protein